MPSSNRPTHRHINLAHDHASRCIYHITMVVSDRLPLLGWLEARGGKDTPARHEVHVQHSDLGKRVSKCIADIPQYAQKKGWDVQILQQRVMDTHLHFVLFVRQPMMGGKVGDLLRGMKIGCNKALREALTEIGWLKDSTAHRIPTVRDLCCPPSPNSVLSQNTATSSSTPSSSPFLPYIHKDVLHDTPLTIRLLNGHTLFEEGYDETILNDYGQLSRMIEYVGENPWRKWIKLHHKNRFVPTRQILIEGRYYDAIGNMLLLGLPRYEVHVRRAFSEQERRDYMNDCILRGRRGYALVSPFISEHEAQVMQVALDEGHSIIRLVENGFTDFQSCSGELYDYCINMQVLLLVPSELPHIDNKGAITRRECVMLNDRAEEMCRRDRAGRDRWH